jgi:triosephosphate isomerase
MRKKIVAGNWKMNLSLEDALALQQKLNTNSVERKCEVILFSPSIFLTELKKNEGQILIGAQNAYPKDSGAYTGEVSIKQLTDINVKHLLVGHSERRNIFFENNELLKEKVSSAIKNESTIIFCVGEELEQREKGIYDEVILKQLKESLFHLSASEFKYVIIAYEPVWAIGTGKTATSEQANEVHILIRKAIAEQYNLEVAEQTSILYGGSCNPKNANELFEQSDIDGGLIGGASLNANDFLAVINAIK